MTVIQELFRSDSLVLINRLSYLAEIGKLGFGYFKDTNKDRTISVDPDHTIPERTVGSESALPFCWQTSCHRV